MTVSQVGPRLALAITAAHPVTRLQLAIVTDDVDVYTSVSGVGRKTAQRIILELKEKVHAAGIAVGRRGVDRLRRRGGARVARLLGDRGAPRGRRRGRHRRRARRPHQGGPPGAGAQPMRSSPADRWSDPEVAERILRSFRVWAVVGCSSRPWRAVVRRVALPAEPGLRRDPDQPEGGRASTESRRTRTCARFRTTLRGPIEVVDLFRRSDLVAPHVEEAIAIGAKAIWMQLEVWNEEAAQLAADAGLLVVMDRCPAIDHPAMVGSGQAET